MKDLKVSIIVPIYNLEKYIGRTVESVKQQTLQDWELILVDDASTDGSLSIMKNFEKEDNRIKVISYSENKGPMYAREQGCKIAQGEYITFCDGDDEISKNAIDILYKAAKQGDADVVVGQLKKIYPDGKEEAYKKRASLNYGDDKEAFLKSILRKENHQCIAGKMFHRNIVKNFNLKIYEHCTMSEDAAVLFQYINQCTKVCVVPDYVYYYYQRYGSSTHTKLSSIQIEGICKLLLLNLDILNQYPNLISDVNRYFTCKMVDLMKYNYDGTVIRLLNKYNLKSYISTRHIFKHFGLKDACNLIIKRDFKSYLYCIKSLND